MGLTAGVSAARGLNVTSLLSTVLRMKGVLRALADTSVSMARHNADAVKVVRRGGGEGDLEGKAGREGGREVGR